MHPVPLHQFVAVDRILADHIVEMSEMGFAVCEGRASVHDPGWRVSPSMELEVVELRRDQRQHSLRIGLTGLPLLKLCLEREHLHGVRLLRRDVDPVSLFPLRHFIL